MAWMSSYLLRASARIRSFFVKECLATYLSRVELDEELNSIRSGEPRRISAANSKVEVLVIPTNEELVIARDTHRIVQASNR